jgi:hypothetical protein
MKEEEKLEVEVSLEGSSSPLKSGGDEELLRLAPFFLLFFLPFYLNFIFLSLSLRIIAHRTSLSNPYL